MALTKELLAKYKAAEPLTDGELSTLFHYYDTLLRSFAGFCPPEYRLIEQDVNKHWITLNGYRTARISHRLGGYRRR